MMNTQKPLWSTSFLIDDVIDDVEVQLIDKFALGHEERKHDDDLDDRTEEPIYFRFVDMKKQYFEMREQSYRLFRNQQEIRSFELALRSESFLALLNASIQTKSAEDFFVYCKLKPELKNLTVTKELTRMNYTIYTPEGKKLTEPNEIAKFIQTDAMVDRHEVVYRAANQTIFADMVTSLTTFDGLIRPQLSSGTFISDSSFVIDLASDHPLVRAECLLNVCIPDGHNGKLAMAGAIAEVCFRPSTNELKTEILHLAPCCELTDEEVLNAAKSLAEV
eukprot:scaffold9079_cov120-Cylindrotheca_fusiformis.AAC.6